MASSDVQPGNGHAPPRPAEEKTLISPGCPGAANPHNTKTCKKRGPRNIAIASIVCGFSCIGIAALIYAMKAEGAEDPEAARPLRRKSRRLSLLSIGLWVAALILLPLFMLLLSYVIARAE
ncbi:transmembrane protein 265 [Ambystoma mexicanum]|uniref:transmembrane protein 265 n=1 Tax=Ambystoma mexicanum TaxID=8296 RepID=UPI0037E97261